MTPRETIEETLRRAARLIEQVPSVAEEVLRRIEQGRAPRGPAEEEPAPAGRGRRRISMKRGWKIAAACVAGLALIATGWAAEKVVRGVIEGKRVEVTTVFVGESNVMPDGSVMTMGVLSSDTGGPEAEAEVTKLIAQRKYKLIKTFEDQTRRTHYVYRFALSNGNQVNRNFIVPLEQVESLEDYNKKSIDLERRRNEAVRQAIAEGRFRLIDMEPLLVHVCQDKVSGLKIDVLRVERPDGRDIAWATESPQSATAPSSIGYQSAWKDHLKAVSEGKRELLDVRIVRHYSYEVTLADGTKTVFVYGGDSPLEKMTRKPTGPEGGK
jgi:hypothetical protein